VSRPAVWTLTWACKLIKRSQIGYCHLPWHVLSLILARIVINSGTLQAAVTLQMQAAPMRREFSFQGLKLPDPNPQMSVEDVRGALAFQEPHPSLPRQYASRVVL